MSWSRAGLLMLFLVGGKDIIPVELCVPNHDSKLPSGRRAATEGTSLSSVAFPLPSIHVWF